MSIIFGDNSEILKKISRVLVYIRADEEYSSYNSPSRRAFYYGGALKRGR